MRTLTYVAAIREAHAQLLERDARVFVIGQGLSSPWYAGGSLDHLDRDFGCGRLLDSPVSENAVTGMAIGAALAGMRPIVFHPRMDFLLLAMDPIVNQAANWSYLFAGGAGVPVVIRAVINRGGEQGAQHSQALHALFMHIPGLKVVMPSTPADAKGLLIAAVEDPNPVLYIDDRWLYGHTGPVSESMTATPIGKAAVRRAGHDVTLIGISSMAAEALEAAQDLGGGRHRRRGNRPAQPQALGPRNRAPKRAQDRRGGDRRSGMENRGGGSRNRRDDIGRSLSQSARAHSPHHASRRPRARQPG